MSPSVEAIFNDHQYPPFLLKNPKWVQLHYWILQILYTRSRVTSKQLHSVLEQIPFTGQILDIGCGEGQYLMPLAQKFKQHQFHGIDIRPHHIQFLKTYLDASNISNVSLEVADIASHTFRKSTSYDCIYMIGILQYLQQHEAIISRLATMQNKGQKMIIYSPIKNASPSIWFQKWKKRFTDYDNSQQNYNALDQNQLLNYWRKNGYTIKQKRYYYGPLGRLGLEIYNALLLIFIHSHITIKIFALLFLLILSPIFVTLQVVDSYIPKKSGNSIMFIAEKN